MEVEFKFYCGLGGDLQTLLIGTTESGIRETTLVPRTGWFKEQIIKARKKRLVKKLISRSKK